mgnify:CR=1 FL=1
MTYRGYLRRAAPLILMFPICGLLAVPAKAQDIWPRPEIVPIPVRTRGVANPVLSLNGTWKFTLSPPDGFWLNEVDPLSWPDIEVPGEAVMQGFKISRNTEYPYKKAVVIPPDFQGKQIILRFDGVYSTSASGRLGKSC